MHLIARALHWAWTALLDLISEPASPAYLARCDRPYKLGHILWPWTRYTRQRRAKR